jgi:hypothetical protein
MFSSKYHRYEIYSRLSSLLEKSLEQEFEESNYGSKYQTYDEDSSTSDDSCNYNYYFYINERSPSCDDSENYSDNNFYERSNVKVLFLF